MTSTTVDLQVKTYIAAVAARLADLPAEERDDLMTDLEQHLHEVLAEGEGTLRERLGTPEAYAAELRASAGLPERTGDARRRFFSNVKERPLVKETLGFLPELKPGWWVLRAVIVAAAMVRLWTSLEGSEGKYILLGLGEAHVLFIGALVAAALTIPSVLLGRAANHNQVARWVSIFGNIPTVIVGVLLVGNSYPVIGPQAPPEYYESSVITEYLHHADGTPISNVCAYTTKLRLLGGVLLFDQDGRPIANPKSVYSDAVVEPRGRGFANLYPRKYLTYDEMGAEKEVPFECPSLAKTAKDKKSPPREKTPPERAGDRD